MDSFRMYGYETIGSILLPESRIDYVEESGKGYLTVGELTGNGDNLHGYIFRSQKEADEFLRMYRKLFPLNGTNYDYEMY